MCSTGHVAENKSWITSYAYLRLLAMNTDLQKRYKYFAFVGAFSLFFRIWGGNKDVSTEGSPDGEEEIRMSVQDVSTDVSTEGIRMSVEKSAKSRGVQTPCKRGMALGGNSL